VIRLALRVAEADAELVLAELLELAPSGVEERRLEDGAIEYAVYGAAGELPSLPALQAAAGGRLVEITTTDVADDWDQQWKAFHKPVRIENGGRALRVRPPWEARVAGQDEADLVIDPGQAFGTGAHATTRLCLELLLALDPADSCVDIGCGSGVLAIAATKLGWLDVLALDYEAESVEATLTNAAANEVTLRAQHFDLRSGNAAPGAELVLANLLLPLLVELSAVGFAAPEPQTVIASGLLVEQADEVSESFAAKHGLTEVDRRISGEWAALLLIRGS
jgi:ribosomal protein L11 methyltransferase